MHPDMQKAHNQAFGSNVARAVKSIAAAGDRMGRDTVLVGKKLSSEPIKNTGSFQGEPNKLGGGGRFKQMIASGKSSALAAFIGRKKYGKERFQQMAAKGKKGG